MENGSKRREFDKITGDNGMVWQEDNLLVELTYDYLNVNASMNKVKSPKAGAIVIFAGMSIHIYQVVCVERLNVERFRDNSGQF